MTDLYELQLLDLRLAPTLSDEYVVFLQRKRNIIFLSVFS